jgi:hypothetical protein
MLSETHDKRTRLPIVALSSVHCCITVAAGILQQGMVQVRIILPSHSSFCQVWPGWPALKHIIRVHIQTRSTLPLPQAQMQRQA